MVEAMTEERLESIERWAGRGAVLLIAELTAEIRRLQAEKLSLARVEELITTATELLRRMEIQGA